MFIIVFNWVLHFCHTFFFFCKTEKLSLATSRKYACTQTYLKKKILLTSVEYALFGPKRTFKSLWFNCLTLKKRKKLNPRELRRQISGTLLHSTIWYLCWSNPQLIRRVWKCSFQRKYQIKIFCSHHPDKVCLDAMIWMSL